MPKVKIDGNELEVDLTEEELEWIKKTLGRTPTVTELGMFDVMHSEHCSYKSSRPKLRLFENAEENYDYVLAGPGQDAGVIDIGDGYALAFRIESHNHPSAIEPYHGAATGIGGMIRDVLCMGVRPIAVLDPLRFGPLKNNPHSQWLFKEAIRGLADYGNGVGVPNIGGEIEFDKSFQNNCLVNACCIGLGTIEDFKHAPSKATYPGDYIVLMGASTRRDGIHGVTFASKSLTEMSEDDRPAVPTGDPFNKKKIIEATLEAVKTGYVRGLKDLGGGGLSCALSELTGDGGTGAKIDMSKVFTGEPNMNSFEIMLSESQERMAFIVKAEGLERILDIFRKFDMPNAVLGMTDDSQVLEIKNGNDLPVCLPAKALSDAPTIPREEKRPKFLDELLAQKTPEPTIGLEEIIYKLITAENICSKEWVYRQFDHEVGLGAVVKCGDGDSGVIRIPGTNKFIAASVGVNSKHCFLDPYEGAKGGLVEVCGNVIANGAKPMAMANCCNFGNPNNPESFWYFSKAVEGMADFCRELRIPVIGGNVSLYNEDEVTHSLIKPTPLIMIVGIIEGQENIITLPFKEAGDDILLIGDTKVELGGSEYHSELYDLEGGTPPKVNEKDIKNTWDFISELYKEKLIKANHDVNKGGFIITIAEMCFKKKLGADLQLSNCFEGDLRDDELLFSESVGRFVIETNPEDYSKIMENAKRYNVYIKKIGVITSKSEIHITGLKRTNIKLDVEKMKELYDSAIPNIMEL